MIVVRRTSESPPIFFDEFFAKMKAELKEFYDQPIRTRRQLKPPYETMPATIHAAVGYYLRTEFSGKCAYCETVMDSLAIDFDHFRPKSSAKGQDKDFSLDHYWWLAFDWRNMYLCCPACNKHKLNWFPVEGKRAEVELKYEKVVKTEKALLVDPCNDDPEKHFLYTDQGFLDPVTRQGHITIEYLGLNRSELIRGRYKAMVFAQKDYHEALMIFEKRKKAASNPKSPGRYVQKLMKLIMELCAPKSSIGFAGIQRYFLREWLRKDVAFAAFLMKQDKTKSVEQLMTLKNPTAGATRTKVASKKKKQTGKKEAVGLLSFNRLKIESIEVKNFKGIEDLVIKYPSDSNLKGQSWLMLLGENGAGKSSLLQAIAMTLMGKRYMDKLDLDPKDFHRNETTDPGYIKINQDGQETVQLHFTKTNYTHNIGSMGVYLLGYGSTRIFSTPKIKSDPSRGKIRAKNLFEADTGLYGEDWLLALNRKNKSRFDFACRALRDLLAKELNDDNLTFGVKDGKLWMYYSKPGKHPVRMKQLSDGYKSVIALACDMMYALLKDNITIESAEGIVLIDEIGTHLHPRWKMRVVNSFRNAFPKMQFIVTTHDPLCLKGLKAGEVVVVERDRNDKVVVKENLPDPGEFSAEQLLSSKFFGLLSTLDEDLERDFNDYYQLLGQGDNISEPDKIKLMTLKDRLKDKRHMGQTLREELALTAADQILAEEKENEADISLASMHEQTKALLKNLWNSNEKVSGG